MITLLIIIFTCAIVFRIACIIEERFDVMRKQKPKVRWYYGKMLNARKLMRLSALNDRSYIAGKVLGSMRKRYYGAMAKLHDIDNKECLPLIV